MTTPSSWRGESGPPWKKPPSPKAEACNSAGRTLRRRRVVPALRFLGRFREPEHSEQGYVIDDLQHPHTTSGKAENGPASMKPAIAGLMEDARLRGTAVRCLERSHPG
jgi:hypothetical protein